VRDACFQVLSEALPSIALIERHRMIWTVRGNAPLCRPGREKFRDVVEKLHGRLGELLRMKDGRIR